MTDFGPAVAMPPITPTGWMAYQHTAARVVLKPDALDDLGTETDALGCRRVMLVCGQNTARTNLFRKAREVLGSRVVATLDRVVEHSSTDLVTEAAGMARASGVDGFVAVGGGSASDTAKGIAILLAEGGSIEDHASTFVPPDKFYPKELHKPKLPVVAVPSTASGAECTPGLGIRNAKGEKRLFWHIKLACRLIVLDPVANLEVPAPLLATTSMNGFAHCAEGLYSRLRNPVSEAIALHGARMFTSAVPAMVEEPDNPEHRAAVLAAAHLGGLVISNARVGIHHAICHCLGAAGGLPHGVANAIMLPHALAYNLPVATGQLAKLGEAMGANPASRSESAMAEAAIEAVRELQRRSRVPTRLRDVGLARDRLPVIAEHTLHDRGLFFNPRRTESAEPILAILEEAW
jgi:alcohol dehydrogenase